MKLWVWKPHMFVLLLLGLSSIVTVSGFTEKDLELITKRVQGKYRISKQYAYAIKFDQNECNSLNDNVITNALEDDKANDVIKDVETDHKIYIGKRLTMATFKNLSKNRRQHAEYRLLFLRYGNGGSPVQELLNKAPAAGCALFYTLNSPCQAYCTNPNGKYSILQNLTQFSCINNRAFVYKQMYHKDAKLCCTDHLRSVNNKMPLYRCPEVGECFKCFSTSTSTATIDNRCIT